MRVSVFPLNKFKNKDSQTVRYYFNAVEKINKATFVTVGREEKKENKLSYANAQPKLN